MAKNGFEVHLIVADGKGNETKNGVRIHDIGNSKNRLQRFFFSTAKAFKKAYGLDAELYHFHDPELLRVGLKLSKRGKKVVYDAHEDVPRQVLDKAYLPTIFRRPLSRLLENFENRIVSKLSGVVTVTPNLHDRFLQSTDQVTQVRNFPRIEEFQKNSSPSVPKENAVCYVGAITKVRGILNMIDAMQYDNGAKLLLGGKFESVDLRNKAMQGKGWKNVEELGFLDREEVKYMLSRSVAGLVVLEPTPSYLTSIPVKMFEYMIAGIPVIASDFSYWRALIEKEDCALFVNPLKPKEISEGIKKLIENKELAAKMGSNGRQAVIEKFNWNKEEKQLLAFYEQILK